MTGVGDGEKLHEGPGADCRPDAHRASQRLDDDGVVGPPHDVLPLTAAASEARGLVDKAAWEAGAATAMVLAHVWPAPVVR